jgi:glycosyltransferase involved in cell wall biosynthesis
MKKIIFLLNTVGEGSGPLQRANVLNSESDYQVEVVEFLGKRRNFNLKEVKKTRKKLRLKYDVKINGIDAPSFKSLSSYLKLIRFLKNERPDTVICHHNVMGIIGVFCSLIAGVKNIIKIEMSDMSRKSFLENIALVVSYMFVSKVVFISNSSKNSLSKIIGIIIKEKSMVIYNGINLAKIPLGNTREITREKYDIDKDTVLIFTATRIHPVKNLDFLIKSFAQAQAYLPNSVLYIAGWGDISQLEKLANELSIRDKVKFLGPITREEVLNLMSASDIYTMTSLFEGLSESLIQALACSCPSVLTDIPSFRETIRNGIDGFLVNNGNEELFAKKFSMIGNDKELWLSMSGNAKERARDIFSIEDVIERYKEIV